MLRQIHPLAVWFVINELTYTRSAARCQESRKLTTMNVGSGGVKEILGDHNKSRRTDDPRQEGTRNDRQKTQQQMVGQSK